MNVLKHHHALSLESIIYQNSSVGVGFIGCVTILKTIFTCRERWLIEIVGEL